MFFHKLKKLNKHIDYLSQKISNKNIFLVWGCIRNILLDIEKDIFDIDFTMAWKPLDIFEHIKKDNISIFKTDKFGTITIIPKDENKENKLQYELTPFRTEWKYEDFRHPEEITWSNDIILDSMRRDFTINSLYYCMINYELEKDYETQIEQKDMLKTLEREWNILIQNTFVIEDHDLIQQFFKNWIINKNIIIDFISKNEKNIYNSKKWKRNLNIIIDPQYWIQDMINKKIRTVWNPDNRFGEDSLRIIRWARFVNTLNQKLEKFENDDLNNILNLYFDFDKETRQSMKRNFFLVEHIAKERLKIELDKVFKLDNPFWFITLLDELNILKYIFPSLAETKYNAQPVRYHPFDTYSHSILSLFHLQKINKDYLTKFGTLYHDVGKPDQYYYYSISTDEKKKHNKYLDHRFSWIEKAKKDFKNLWFSNKEIDEIVFYIWYHHYPWEIISGKESNIEKKINKLMSEFGYKKTLNLLDIVIWDMLWQYNPIQKSAVWWVNILKSKLNELYQKQWEFNIKNLNIDWNDIIEYFKIEKWPKVWIMKEKALDRVLEDTKNRNKKEKIIKYLKKEFY